jgi:hypothetical protein
VPHLVEDEASVLCLLADKAPVPGLLEDEAPVPWLLEDDGASALSSSRALESYQILKF